MAIHRLERRQYINAPLQKVWEFFSSPGNLAVITPPYMKFTVTSPPHAGSIYKGQEISYKVSPVLGIPLKWVTEITEVEDRQSFVDEQLRGPYKLWRHKHVFEQQGDGVLMTDTVDYELPYGIFGSIAHLVFVKSQLADIFNFRKKIVSDLFPGSDH